LTLQDKAQLEIELPIVEMFTGIKSAILHVMTSSISFDMKLKNVYMSVLNFSLLCKNDFLLSLVFLKIVACQADGCQKIRMKMILGLVKYQLITLLFVLT